MRRTYSQALRALQVMTAAALLVATISTLEAAGPGSVDMGFAPEVSLSTGHFCIAEQADGKLLVGGAFTLMNGTRRGNVARLNSDWTLDASFNVGEGADGSVTSLAVLAGGKILIGGAFTYVHGVKRSYIARLNADGSLDSAFGASGSPDGWVWASAVQPDGKILIAGAFTHVAGVPRNRLARLNVDGTLDTGFNPGSGVDNTVFDLALQPDGKVLIAGFFSQVNGIARPRVARLLSDGSVDMAFDAGVSASSSAIRAIALQADGKVLVGGKFVLGVGGSPRWNFARLNADGSGDATFPGGGGAYFPEIREVALQPDGKVIVAGQWPTSGVPNPDSYFARLHGDGTYDAGFPSGTGPNGTVLASIVRADGKIVLAGGFTSIGGLIRNKVARLAADFTVDTAVAPPPVRVAGFAESLAVQPDGKVLAGGWYDLVNGSSRRGIVRLNADGTLDSGFETGSGTNSAVFSLAHQTDGKTVLAGYFTTVNGVGRGAMARLHKNGAVDSYGGVLFENAIAVDAMAMLPDGKVVIGGPFTYLNGYPYGHVARLTDKGHLDHTFTSTVGANDDVKAIALQPDGKVLIGGAFTTIDGTARNRIGRLTADGILDTTFDPGIGVDSTVLAIAVRPDGKVLIAGDFTTVDGAARSRIARLNADGSLDTSFLPGTGADAAVSALVIQPDGRVVIAGGFRTYDGSSRRGIARLNANGSLDGTFDPGTGLEGGAYSLALQPDGKILVGGGFTSADGTFRSGLARLYGSTDPFPVGIDVDRTAPPSGTSNLNRVLEPGESVVLEPTWRNPTANAQLVTGELGPVTGPGSAGFTLLDAASSYGTLAVDASASCLTGGGDCFALALAVPASRPAFHWDVIVTEAANGTASKAWTIHVGDSFADVPRSHWAYRYVETAFHAGLTSGCAVDPLRFCPGSQLTRAEMAVLLLMAERGPGWVPPASTGTVFTDVPIDHWAGDFIEELAAEGITGGCGAGSFCPDAPVTRAEAAVLLLSTDHGPAWVPAASTGTVFTDVPIDHWAGDFIEELAAAGITGGCGGGAFCPDSVVTRAEMAVFLAETFGLALYH